MSAREKVRDYRIVRAETLRDRGVAPVLASYARTVIAGLLAVIAEREAEYLMDRHIRGILDR